MQSLALPLGYTTNKKFKILKVDKYYFYNNNNIILYCQTIKYINLKLRKINVIKQIQQYMIKLIKNIN